MSKFRFLMALLGIAFLVFLCFCRKDDGFGRSSIVPSAWSGIQTYSDKTESNINIYFDQEGTVTMIENLGGVAYEYRPYSTVFKGNTILFVSPDNSRDMLWFISEYKGQYMVLRHKPGSIEERILKIKRID